MEKTPEAMVKAKFHRSKSKLYNRAKSIAKSFPYYDNQGDAICCAISNIYDFCRLQQSVHELIQIISKWKYSEIWLYEKQFTSRFDYYDFLELVKNNAGKYKPLINESPSLVSLGAITIENLPYPVVYYPDLYGAFFAFSKDIGEPIVFCECERTAIENYLKMRKARPPINYYGDKANPLGTDCFPPTVSRMSKGCVNPLSRFAFKEKICFRCNKIVPMHTYCVPMYGGAFKQHYGWYIQQEYYRLGIDRRSAEWNVIEEMCDPETYDSLKRLADLNKKEYADSSIEEINEKQQLQAQINLAIENSVRTQFGFKKIGDAWISETILYEIVSEIFSGEDIKRHYRPSWLEGLELDIFIPNLNIAFEYQGIQHFHAVKHWGGEKQLMKQKEHDARKKRICSERGINLICINYNEPLTTEYVANRIND